MEQNGTGDPNVMHWQTNNDNTNVELTLVQGTQYVLTGRFTGTTRYFSSATLDGLAPTFVESMDASHTITAGTKPLSVGTSDAGEASNAVIGELVYYDRALSDVERDAVIAYLRSVWRP
ncbi:MAG: hypothetical protein NT062_32325 [Proteobacteria bacterium]|nr:hypothetical protein [Pseudomonadota bacterium]